MAPVSACRLLLCCLIVWYSNCGALVVYDCQSLLDIRSTFFNFHKSDVECVFNKSHGSFTTDIPECIRCWPLNNPGRKRRRKCGSRGGLKIKLKARLHAGCISSPFLEPLYGCSVVWCLLDHAPRWLRPVLPLILPSVPQVDLPRIGRYLRRTGVAPGVLRPLCRVSLSPDSVPPSTQYGLIACSVVNKTFLLNYFFCSHILDFMFITESWIKDGDLIPFSELVPDCTFFNSPRQNG